MTPVTPAMKVDSLPTEPPGEPFISIIDINFSFKFIENNIETCILSYMKQITSPGSMHETGCSGLVHWDDPEGWDGREVGGGFRMGNTCIPMADSYQCMAKTTTIL